MKALLLAVLILLLLHRYISQPSKRPAPVDSLSDCADEWPVHDGRPA
jgi:hypothetical protein